MKKIILLLCCFTFTIFCYAQQSKLSFPVIKKLVETENKETQVALLIKGEEAAIREITLQQGGTFKYSRHGISSVMIPIKGINDLAASNAISRIEDGAPRLQLMGNDTMRYMNRIINIHNGVAPLTQPYTGEGVLLGIIDTGIDYTHPDFQDTTGGTRIRFIWDHLLTDSLNTPQPYNYGQEFTQTDINNGLATAHHDQGVHGSVITGIAAGNANATGEFKGAAPDADLIIVSINFNVSDEQFLSSIADAVDYIYNKADSLGMPCIINISAGTYYGSHDGNDLATQMIDGLITAKNGRSLVCASGNAGGFPLHTRTVVNSGDTVFTWFKNASAISYCEFWGDTAAMSNLQFTIGADQTTPNYAFRGSLPYTTIQQQLGVLHTDTLYSTDSNRIAIIMSYGDLIGGQYGMFYQVTADSAYNWRIQTTGSGSWDGYTFDWIHSSLIPTAASYPPVADYRSPDVNQNMCSGFQCSDKTITVAQFTNMNNYVDYNNTVQTFSTVTGQLHPTSSWGPTRDGRQKPDVAASGEWIFGPLIVTSQPWFILNQPFKIPPTAQHLRGNGTSAASAVVSGIVALYMEKYPFANWQQIKDAVINCSYTDNFTGGALPNNRWGHGKTDAFSMLTNCGVTTMEEPDKSSEPILCFPNPGSGITTVYYPELKSNATLSIYNSEGKLVWSDLITTGTNNTSVNVSTFASGIYNLQITGVQQSASGRFVR